MAGWQRIGLIYPVVPVFVMAILMLCGEAWAQKQSPDPPSHPSAVGAGPSASQANQAQADPQSPSSTSKHPTPAGTETSATQPGQVQVASPLEVAAEGHPRILGLIPTFGVTNLQNVPPLTVHEKFKLFTRQAFDPFQWIAAGAEAGFSQAEDRMEGYGQGAAGYGKRYGAAMADLTDHEFISNFLLPVALKQDPRYFRLGYGPFPHRFFYALEQEFWCKTDQGSREFNYSKVLGAFAAKGISNLYYPPASRGFGVTISRSGFSILSGMATAVGEEFWPDIECKLFRVCGGK